ncbi:MAG TPA: TetR/AcrR family transcriptional regulator [Streptosporangiaceae bacterium]|nr:TetR/AcrR family transcriptional regulator [Streptosporangiaceae bacterium]
MEISAVPGSTVPASPVPASPVPASVAAAWGVREQPRRGPRPALSLARIVDAAVRVADTEGLEAVSMSRVAAEAGSAAMSLYRHVAGKEQLLDLMVDAAWGPAPVPLDAGESWRDGLSRWAWGMRRSAQRRPWVVRIPLNSLPIMPNQVAWFDHALVSLAGTGLPEARKASVIMLLAGYVRNIATTEADIAAAVRRSGQTPLEWMASYSRMLTRLADPHRFPSLARFTEAGVFESDDDPDDEFIFGLDRILAGIALLISAGRQC